MNVMLLSFLLTCIGSRSYVLLINKLFSQGEFDLCKLTVCGRLCHVKKEEESHRLLKDNFGKEWGEN